jgi:endonuclease G
MCSNCSKTPTDHDVKEALININRKYTELAEMMDRALELTAEEDVPRRASEARAMRELLARIVGGERTSAGEFPECCLIGRESTIGTTDWFCTGVLVHPRIVITAAHCCVPPDMPNVVAFNALDYDNLDGSEIVKVRRAIVHPSYAQTDPLNDIAVLVLRTEARTASVPIATTKEFSAARRTTLVGFGRDDIFSTRGFGIQRKVTVGISKPSAKELDAFEQRFDYESDLEFLAGGSGFDSCNGDSGGPAYLDSTNGRRVLGLTSRATRGAKTPCGEGSVNTRVDVHRDFIIQTMRALKITGDL